MTKHDLLTENGLIEIDRYPELYAICWSRRGAETVTPSDAFGLYTTLWAYVCPENMGNEEKQLLAYLTEIIGDGRFEPHQIPTWQMKNHAHEIAKDLGIVPPPANVSHQDLLVWLAAYIRPSS